MGMTLKLQCETEQNKITLYGDAVVSILMQCRWAADATKKCGNGFSIHKKASRGQYFIFILLEKCLPVFYRKTDVVSAFVFSFLYFLFIERSVVPARRHKLSLYSNQGGHCEHKLMFILIYILDIVLQTFTFINRIIPQFSCLLSNTSAYMFN